MPRLPQRLLSVLATMLALLGASGCALFHGWAAAGSHHPFRAGAAISMPMGK